MVAKLNLKLLRNPNSRKVVVFAVLGFVLFSAVRAYTAENYPDPDYPYYSGAHAVEITEAAEALTIVSYNIWFGQDVRQASAELKQIQSQSELDVILLQEIDEAGTEQIARELRLNYVYFPAAIEPTYNKNFGNAILSRWPIVDAKKIILPHKSLSNRMNRIATRGTIRIHENDILVYSVHTESIFTLPRFRKDQYEAVLQDIDQEAQQVIVGGDFNSFTQTDIQEVENVYEQAGFVRASEPSGHTLVRFGVGVTSDHIFAKGFAVKEAGKMMDATASDHLPIWVTVSPE